MTVGLFQLLIATTIAGAGALDSTRCLTVGWWPFATFRHPVASAWVLWTMAMVFMPWLMAVQLVVVVGTWVVVNVGVSIVDAEEGQRRLTTTQRRLGTAAAAVTVLVLGVVGLGGVLVISAILDGPSEAGDRHRPTFPQDHSEPLDHQCDWGDC